MTEQRISEQELDKEKLEHTQKRIANLLHGLPYPEADLFTVDEDDDLAQSIEKTRTQVRGLGKQITDKIRELEQEGNQA